MGQGNRVCKNKDVSHSALYLYWSESAPINSYPQSPPPQLLILSYQVINSYYHVSWPFRRCDLKIGWTVLIIRSFWITSLQGGINFPGPCVHSELSGCLFHGYEA